SRDRRQPLPFVSHCGHRERLAGIRVEGRQRLQPGGAARAAGDMRLAGLALAALAGCGTPAVPPNAPPQRSGFEEMSASLQAMQRDDSANPAMLWVQEGEQLWTRAAGGAPSCAGCHGDVSRMKGVATRYPA